MATYPTVGSSPWSATLQTYIDAGDAQPGVSLGVSNGTNDTSTIISILAANAGSVVRGVPGQAYKITTITGVPSNTTIDMTGCTVQQIAGTNADMVQLASQTAARTLMDGVSNGTTTFTSATANFVVGDVGATVYVFGGGTSGQLVKTTIASRTNSTTVVLNGAIPATATGLSFSVGPRVSNAVIVGGIWDKQTNAGSSYVFRMRRSDNCAVRNLRVISATGPKYAVNWGDAVDFTAENLSFDYQSDGVHVNGPIHGGVIRNISGFTRDDMVSLTPNDWVGVNDVWGDIVGVKVDGVDLVNGNNCAFKVLGGSASPATAARGIRARNISGSTDKTAQTFGGLAMIGDDTGSANTTGGFCDDITIEGVSGQVPDNSNLVVVAGTNIGTVLIDGVGWDSTTNTAGPVAVGGGTGTIQHAIVRNVRINRLKVNANAVSAQANVTTKRLTLENITVKDWQSTTSSTTLISLGGPGGVEKVDAKNIRVIASTGGTIFGVNANVQSLLVDQVEINNTSNSAFIVTTSTSGVVVADCTITRVIGTSGWTAGYIAQASSTTSGFTRLTIAQAHCTGVGGSPFLGGASSGLVLGTLILADSTFVGTSWGLGDFATATEILLDGITVASAVNGLVNLRASGSLKVRGEGNSVAGNVNITAGGIWSAYTGDPPFTATAGGVPTIAAGAGAGTGPTVSIVGNDRMGTITVTTGTTPSAAALATITFTRAFGAAPRSVMISPTSSGAGAVNPYISSKATTNFVLSAQAAPVAATSHTFDYLVTA